MIFFIITAEQIDCTDLRRSEDSFPIARRKTLLDFPTALQHFNYHHSCYRNAKIQQLNLIGPQQKNGEQPFF